MLGMVILQQMQDLADKEMVRQFAFNIEWHYALNVTDPSKQRLDSVHIFSNMAHLGRIRLFVKTIRKFLVNLKRHQPELYQALAGC